MSEEDKKTVRRFMDAVINKRDFDLINEFTSPSIVTVWHYPDFPPALKGLSR